MAKQRGEHETTLLAMRDPESEEDHFATLSYIGKVLDDMQAMSVCRLAVADLTPQSTILVTVPEEHPQEYLGNVHELFCRVFPNNEVILLTAGMSVEIAERTDNEETADELAERLEEDYHQEEIRTNKQEASDGQ